MSPGPKIEGDESKQGLRLAANSKMKSPSVADNVVHRPEGTGDQIAGIDDTKDSEGEERT